ncbi:hypothetical protein CVT25_006906 [Psilocybe cyanescens]|uniref:F-box domain-containing protein n=1 Tax=Psilocybe cyanescens TaxID=93625 RepID=A0A409X642_PSICY|nr:hypothetical protein CVT25_006906 [Psilocybe cyanescens]
MDNHDAWVTSIKPIEKAFNASPVSKINEDLLRLIFQTNVRVEATVPLYVYVDLMNRPLTTARLSSQVCRSWRRLLLDSPSIWGRLIHLDSLDQKNNHWREELLRRTQSSPLWVTGNVTGSTENPTPVRVFFYYLLQNPKCWERIEKLEIIVHGEDTSDSVWNTFLTPAPNLRIFEIYFPNVREPLFQNTISPNSNKRLFGNHAPRLLEFHADGIEFAVDSSWLSNLREIATPSRLTVPEILDLLLHMPLLESFFLQFSEATEEWLPSGILPHIELPALTIMLLTNSLATCSTLLEHMYPAKTCSLALTTNSYYAKKFISKDVLRSLKQNLPRYIHNYFSTYISTRIRLRFFDDVFHFEDESHRHTHHIFFTVCIYTKADSSEASENKVLTDFLLQVFAKCALDSPSRFSSVTELSLDMRYADTTSLPYFHSMLSSFPSVRNLKTNEDSVVFLCSLFNLQQDEATGNRPSTLFPHLQVLELTYLDPDHYLLPDTIPGALLPFLKLKKESGQPINTLDLRLCGSDTLRDIEFLEEIEGLEVLTLEGAVEESYICGSGMPDKLRFRTRSGWNSPPPASSGTGVGYG